MINALIFKSSGRICGFELSGHSGYSEQGSDIVCAAVSSVAQFTIAGISETLHLSCDYELSEGNISLKLGKDISHEAENFLATFEMFLVQLESQYSNYLKITVMEE